MNSLDDRRRGLTLIEMLVAIAATLILMFAVVSIFKQLGDNINAGRATIEMAGELRAVAHRLQQDLDGVTVQTLPWASPESGPGYFEYIEGTDKDLAHVAETRQQYGNLFGDWDDMLAFTARSRGRPFTGRYNGAIIESDVAEIIWWARHNDYNGNGAVDPGESVNLYRRVLLVRPDLNDPNTGAAPGITNVLENDISARPGGGGFIANSLEDLTRRENRFAHVTAFPSPLIPTSPLLQPQTGEFYGEDVVLAHLLAFDVKAFDPYAPIRASGRLAVTPNDPGWRASGGQIGMGAFVDLNYAGDSSVSQDLGFSGPPLPPSNSSTWPLALYDTWPLDYERDGIDQDGDGAVDGGNDGLDNNGVGGVDDPGERETRPPYPVPLRGVRVVIRMFEPGSRQIRQVSVTADFVPE